MKHFDIDRVYESYFGKAIPNAPLTSSVMIEEPEQTELLDGPLIGEQLHQRADDERDCLELIGELLQQLTNASWGTGWGQVTLDTPTGNDPTDVTLPCITLDMNSREVQEKRSLKPKQTRAIKEVINGVATGDTLLVFQQFFDCILEINFFANNLMEARKLMHRFEKLMIVYAGFIKSEGVDEIIFLKEVNAKHSINYTSHLAMKCTMYYVRVGREYIVRSSSIHGIQIELNHETGKLEE